MDIEQQLRAALAPATPGPQVRAAVMARLAAGPGRRIPKLWVVVGAVIALGAAAAMLAMQLLESVASAVIVHSPPVPAVPRVGIHDVPVSLDTAATGATQGKESQPVALAIKPFTVQMLPLQNDVVDAPRKAAIAAVYAALVDGLHAVPGLTLVEPATDESESPVSADYRLILKGEVVPASATVKADYFVHMEAQRLGPDGRMISSDHGGMSGEIAPGCVSPASMDVLASATSCADPVGVATGLLATLRIGVFPPDPQLQRGLQARLVDRALDPVERLRALMDLRSLARASATNMRESFAPILRDAAVVRAAIQLASTTPDPAARAQVWYMLRGSRDPELVRPLVAALRADADDDSRVQALATLAADFAADPRAHNALETAAREDPDPLVRALAQRALGAEAGWTEYVLASLKDEGRSPLERVQAFFYAYGLPSPRPYGSFSADGRILRALDDAAMRALTEVLPRAAADSQHYARSSFTLVSELANMDHPAITDMLLDCVSAGATWLTRSFAVEALQRRTGDPKVRAALEKIAAEDADPQLRELAGNTLRGGALQPAANRAAYGAAAATAVPPRLGVMTEYVQPGPNVPAELVGKLVVAQMGIGSVAERAGVREADVLLEIGGKPISSGPRLIEVLDALQKDVDVDVLVSRNGQIVRLTARF